MLPLSHRFPSEGGPPAPPFRFSRKRPWSSRGVGRTAQALSAIGSRPVRARQSIQPDKATDQPQRLPRSFFLPLAGAGPFPPIPSEAMNATCGKNNVSHRIEKRDRERKGKMERELWTSKRRDGGSSTSWWHRAEVAGR